MRAWNARSPPTAIIGNIYYVGTNEIAQYTMARFRTLDALLRPTR